MTLRTRGSRSLSVNWSRWVWRRRMRSSLAASMWATVTGWRSSVTSSSTATFARALTSQGWPWVICQTWARASGVKGWPVSVVCCCNSSATSLSVKLRRVMERTAILKGLVVPKWTLPPDLTL